MIRNISHMDCSYKIKTRFSCPFYFYKGKQASKQAGRPSMDHRFDLFGLPMLI